MEREPPQKTDLTLPSRFLAHQLSDTERVAFEADLMADEHVAQDVEAAARFKIGLQRLRETGELDTLLQAPSRPRLNPMLLAAAVAVIAVSLVLVRMATAPALLLAASVDQLSGNVRPASGSSTHAIIFTRATDSIMTIELPRSREAISLQMVLPFNSRPPYRIVLEPLGNPGAPTGSTEITTLGTDDQVTVFADPSLLRTGRYRLALYAGPEDNARELEIDFSEPR